MKKFIFELNYSLPINLLKMSYYAVAKGRIPGIYKSWDECKAQVDKFSGAAFKKFNTKHQAEEFIVSRGGGGSGKVVGKESESSSVFSVKQTNSHSNSRFQPYSTNSSRVQQIKSNSAKPAKRANKPVNEITRFLASKDGRVNQKQSSFHDLSGQSDDENIQFSGDDEKRFDIYTDGACSNNGYSGAKAGFGIFFGDNHPWNIAKPVIGRATNNNAEIQAVTEAALIAKRQGLKKIRILTDSAFLINCKTKWMSKWKQTGWKTSQGEPVVNKKELLEMEKALSDLDYEFKHVRGHKGIHGNEEADKLARLGAEYYDG